MQSALELSHWESDVFLGETDLIIIGSGIVGLSAAIAFKHKNPKAKVLVLERGWLPQGASTKNAGFACFGSPTELLADFNSMEEKVVLDTVRMRLSGLKKLRQLLGDKNMDYLACGGNEVFSDKQQFNSCADEIHALNRKLKAVTRAKETFRVNSKNLSAFGLRGFTQLIEIPLEGQLNTGKMMRALLEYAQGLGVLIFNSTTVKSFEQLSSGVALYLENGIILKTASLIVATNGFARELVPELSVRPARSQVLITSPVSGLKCKGVFHYEQGYFYFRNVGDRVLLGGGRHIDFQTEETDNFGLTNIVQSSLESLLKENILFGRKFKIEQRWSGIMGLGAEKKPIIKPVSRNVVVAVRMGGMGVAIGALVGELAVKEIMR